MGRRMRPTFARLTTGVSMVVIRGRVEGYENPFPGLALDAVDENGRRVMVQVKLAQMPSLLETLQREINRSDDTRRLFGALGGRI